MIATDAQTALAVVAALTEAGWEATYEYPGFVAFPIDSHHSLATGQHDWSSADVMDMDDMGNGVGFVELGDPQSVPEIVAALVAARTEWLAR